jgi:hypothetical protein
MQYRYLIAMYIYLHPLIGGVLLLFLFHYDLKSNPITGLNGP